MNDPDLSNEYGFPQGIPQFDDALAGELPVDKSATWEEWMRWNPPTHEQPELNPSTHHPSLSADDDEMNVMGSGFSHDSSNCSLSPHELTADFSFQFPSRSQNAIFAFGEDSEPSAMPQPLSTSGWALGSGSVRGTLPALRSNTRQRGSPAKSSGDSSSPLASVEKQEESSTPSLRHSPDSSNPRTTPSSALSPEEAPQPKGKKRKSSDDSVDVPKATPPVKKTAHNMIEKRYRNNLNDKIAALKDAVPSLRAMASIAKVETEDLEGLSPANKNNKATILSKATEYIKHLEAKREDQEKIIATLKAKLEQYDKLALSGSVAMTQPVSSPDGLVYTDDPFTSADAPGQAVVSGHPQGMISVPESMRRLHSGIPNQQHYAPQNPVYPIYAPKPAQIHQRGHHQIQNGRAGNPFLNKFMVGSLAGLLVLEGLSWQEEESGGTSAEKGLSAVPIPGMQALSGIFRHTLHPNRTAHSRLMYEFLKVALILTAFAYVLFPLFNRKPRTKKAAPFLSIKMAPSLASPVEVRRRAWLTAIQTVWVPQHNFGVELAALALKALKLSARKLIGWPGYAFLTGSTEEQEASRVRAWEIALDAQLTGGDAEINKSRLVLTLLASGTLPDTPARLMLKSMHIRVLLWEVANAGYRNWFLFEELSAKLARRYWVAARIERQFRENSNSRGLEDVDALPEHLVALSELECDEILLHSIIQRAYNLAWNKPSAENGQVDQTMDTVVEDFAISSPLDALAAWWSGHIKRRGLVKYLEHNTSTVDKGVEEDLDLAVKTAPPNSSALFRALVAKAILLDDDRETNVNLALDALPSQKGSESPGARVINEIGGAPISADSRMAITIAKGLCLIEQAKKRDSAAARARAVAMINAFEFSESCLTMLGFVSLYKMLSTLALDDAVRGEVAGKLEQFTNYLRCWVGTGGGRSIGLSNATRTVIVRRCLTITKTLNGMRQVSSGGTDSAYASDEHNKVSS